MKKAALSFALQAEGIRRALFEEWGEVVYEDVTKPSRDHFARTTSASDRIALVAEALESSLSDVYKRVILAAWVDVEIALQGDAQQIDPFVARKLGPVLRELARHKKRELDEKGQL